MLKRRYVSFFTGGALVRRAADRFPSTVFWRQLGSLNLLQLTTLHIPSLVFLRRDGSALEFVWVRHIGCVLVWLVSLHRPSLVILLGGGDTFQLVRVGTVWLNHLLGWSRRGMLLVSLFVLGAASKGRAVQFDAVVGTSWWATVVTARADLIGETSASLA